MILKLSNMSFEIPKSNETIKFEITTSPERINQCVYFKNPSEKLRTVIQRVMGENRSDNEDYIAHKKVEAFWQMGHEDDSEEIMIEFWKGDDEAHKEFLAYIQNRYDSLEEED